MFFFKDLIDKAFVYIKKKDNDLISHQRTLKHFYFNIKVDLPNHLPYQDIVKKNSGFRKFLS